MLTYSPLFYKEVELNELPKIQSLYNREECLLSTIEVADDGQIVIGGNHYTPTEQFMKSLSGVLRIPYPFACQIPIDLLQKNVTTLKTLGDRPSIIVFRDLDGVKVPVNIFAKSNPETVLKEAHEIDSDELVEQFRSEGKYVHRRGIMGDYGLCFDVMNEDLGRIHLDNFKVGDYASIGYRLYNPFTLKSTALVMRLIANQYSCSNGMTIPIELGYASLNLTNNLGDNNSYFDAFNRSIDESIGKKFVLKDLSNIFNRMQETPISYRFLNPIINKFKSQPDLFRHIFTINPKVPINNDSDELKFYAKQAKEDENGDSTYTYFDIMFKSTEYRKDLEANQIEENENYTSNLITSYLKQINLLKN